jgi:hypothetical protein
MLVRLNLIRHFRVQLTAFLADKASQPVCIFAAIILFKMAHLAVTNLQAAPADWATGVLFTLNEKYLFLY